MSVKKDFLCNPVFLTAGVSTPSSSRALERFSLTSALYSQQEESIWAQEGARIRNAMGMSLPKNFSQNASSTETRQLEKDSIPTPILVSCSSASEAFRLVIEEALLERLAFEGKNQIYLPSCDSLLRWGLLRKMERAGFVVKSLPFGKEGRISMETLRGLLTPRTGCLIVPWAHPITGVIQPIAEIAEICLQEGILLCVDASAVWGKHFFHWEEVAIDFLTLEGRFFQDPSCTTLLVIRGSPSVTPLVSTPPLAAVQSFRIALEESLDSFDFVCTEVASFKDRFEKEITKRIEGCKVLFTTSERLPHITLLSVEGVHGEALAFGLESRGIFVSTGDKIPEYLPLATLLQEYECDPTVAHGAVRLSFFPIPGLQSSGTELSGVQPSAVELSNELLEALVTALEQEVHRLRSYSEGALC